MLFSFQSPDDVVLGDGRCGVWTSSPLKAGEEQKINKKNNNKNAPLAPLSSTPINCDHYLVSIYITGR